MISITRHIEYLISCHDCVIVPGWGAFIAQSSPARIMSDPSGRDFMVPPARTLTFNPGIDHNDGMLVTSLMRREGLSYDSALREIEHQVSTLRHQLATDGEIVFPRIGRFTLAEGTPAPVFSPDSVSVAAAPCYGLPRLRLMLLPQECALPVEEPVPAAATPAPVIAAGIAEALPADSAETDVAAVPPFAPRRSAPVPSTVKKVVRVAASVALLLGLGIIISTPVSVDRTSANFASVDPSAAMPKVTGPKAVKVETERHGLRIPRDAELSIAIPAEEAQEILPAIPEKQEAAAGPTPRSAVSAERTPAKAAASESISDSSPATHYLIVASLPSRSKAEQYLREVSDPTLRILETRGKFRVYAAKGNSLSDVMQRRNDASFNRSHPDAWVFVIP